MADYTNASNEEYEEPILPPTRSGIQQMEEFKMKPMKRPRKSSSFFLFSLLLLLLIINVFLLGGLYIIFKNLKAVGKDTSELKENTEIAHNKLPNINCKKTAPYQIFTQSETYVQALINCKNAGMELVSILTSTDQENLEKFLLQNKYAGTYHWTSGTNLGNRIFYWVTTGNPIIYSNWQPGEPNHAHTGCIVIDIMPNYGWNDIACTLIFPYICQRPETCK